jgi:nicotinamide riboside transporter PnuC
VSPLHWLLATASLTGVVLNIRRRRESFAIWVFSNAIWCAVDAAAGLLAQATLMAIYSGLAVWGFFAWRPPTPPGPA